LPYFQITTLINLSGRLRHHKEGTYFGRGGKRGEDSDSRPVLIFSFSDRSEPLSQSRVMYVLPLKGHGLVIEPKS